MDLKGFSRELKQISWELMVCSSEQELEERSSSSKNDAVHVVYISKNVQVGRRHTQGYVEQFFVTSQCKQTIYINGRSLKVWHMNALFFENGALFFEFFIVAMNALWKNVPWWNKISSSCPSSLEHTISSYFLVAVIINLCWLVANFDDLVSYF